MNKYNPEKLKQFISQLTEEMGKEEIDRKNKEENEKAEKDYNRFKDHFHKGICYLCGLPLDSVKEEDPCVHWLLRKNFRFKKNKHLLKITEKFSFFQTQCYLRWCASLELPFGNINDFNDEVSNPQNFEATIRYQNIEWTFSCTDNDIKGHEGKDACYPHYHFQMKVDGLPFIRFNEFHIALTEIDLFNFMLFKNNDVVEHSFGRGESVKKIFEKFNPEEIIRMAKVSNDDSKSLYNFSTVVTAEDGQLIDGSKIADLLEERKKTGVPMAELLKKLPNTRLSTTVSPSQTIPEHHERNGRNKKPVKDN